MNLQTLLYFLKNRVVPSGHLEAEELIKLVEQIEKMIGAGKEAA